MFMQYAYPLLAIFIWAGNTVVTKMSAGSIFPAEIGFYRWLLAGLLFTPFMLKPVIAHWSAIRPNLGRIFILGVLGMAVYQSLAYFAASLTTATNMGIILSLMPLMSLAMAIISLGQRLGFCRRIAILHLLLLRRDGLGIVGSRGRQAGLHEGFALVALEGLGGGFGVASGHLVLLGGSGKALRAQQQAHHQQWNTQHLHGFSPGYRADGHGLGRV